MLSPEMMSIASRPQVMSLEQLYPDMAQERQPLGMQELRAPQPRYASIRLESGQASRLITQLREHYDEAMEHREAIDWQRALRYRRYLADATLRDGMQPWTEAPQVFTSLTRITIEQIVDRQLDILVPDYERICVKGIGNEDVPGASKKQQFLRWALEKLNQFRAKLKDALTDAALDGLGILKVYPKRVSFDGWLTPDELAQYGTSIALLQTIIEIDAIDQGCLMIPPDATGLQWPEARYLGQELWVHPVDDFPEMRQRGYELTDVPSDGYEPEGATSLQEREQAAFRRDGDEPPSMHRGRVPMIESYERFDIDGSGVRKFVVAHWFPDGTYGELDGGGGQLARVCLLKDVLPQTQVPRPMWPYFPLRFWRQARHLRGMNVPDRLMWQQDVLNRLIEQCLHAGEIDMLPFFFYNAAVTGVLPDLTQVKPGQGVPINPGGGVTFKPNSSHTQHYAELINLVKGFAEEDSSVTSQQQGRSATQPNQPRTASGLAMLLQEGNKTEAAQAKDMAEQVDDPLEMALALWQSHMPPQIEIPMPDTAAIEQRLLQGDAIADVQMTQVQFTAAEMSGRFDLSLQINPDAMLEQQKELTMAERLDAMLQDYPIGRRQMWKQVWERLGLQQFDLFWPEEVARMQTMIRILQADVGIMGLEAQVMQMGMAGMQPPPEASALLAKGGAQGPSAVSTGGLLGSAMSRLLGQGGSPDAGSALPGIGPVAQTQEKAAGQGAQLTGGE